MSAEPPPLQVQPLSEGLPNALEAHWPERRLQRVNRAELLSLAATGAHRGRPRGQALVCAGGGYLQLMLDKEGIELAQWLSGLGLDAHVLVHRLPGQHAGGGGKPERVWPADIALRDGLAALQVLARRTPQLPLVHVGLSSGGHLSGVLACQPHPAPLRLAGALMAYAPINANHRDHKAPAGKPDYPPPEKQAFYDAWPIGIASQPQGLPPCPLFLAYGLHDSVVPLDHALNLVRTLQHSGGDAELHVYPQAPHGFALRDRQGTHAHWPETAAHWLDRVLAP